MPMLYMHMFFLHGPDSPGTKYFYKNPAVIKTVGDAPGYYNQIQQLSYNVLEVYFQQHALKYL